MSVARMCAAVAAVEFSVDWGKRIKDYRALHGLTQEAFAYQFNVDRTTVSRWERDVDEPALVYRKRILGLTMTIEERIVGSMIDHIDALDGLATFVDDRFRVVRTTRAHQTLMKYNASDVYGVPSERYWSQEMQEVVKHIGGLDRFRSNGIRRMDLTIVRQSGECGFGNERPVAVRGRTVAVGCPHAAIGYLTTMTVLDAPPDPPVRLIETADGPV